MKKIRLDQLVVTRGLAESREAEEIFNLLDGSPF